MTLPLSFPLVIGHRGAAGHAPENTLAGFREAARLGAKWVEFDVHLTADGVPVLLHDHTLDRTTNGKGPIDGINLAELQTLDAGTWFDERFAGEPVPTLERTLGVLASLGLGANVEIKPSPGREAATGHTVGRMLREAWPHVLPPPLVSSFSEASLAACRQAAPELARGLLTGKIDRDWSRAMRELDCTTLHGNHRNLTRDIIAEVRQAGYPVLAYTVNDGARAAALLDWGLAAVISDFPDRMPRR